MSNESQDHLLPTGSKDDKVRRRMIGLIQQTEKWFKDNLAEEAVRNLAYYRGRFWSGDGITIATKSKGYAAQKNEVFPIVDTIVSTLAMDLPQVEVLDHRANTNSEPSRETDATIQGRRISAIMNWFAEEDELDTTVQEMVLHSLLFRRAVVKVSWSSAQGRPIWRTKLPWEVHFDPMAKRAADAAWCFETFTIHIEDLKQRIKSKVYKKPKNSIAADSFPRTLIDNYDTDIDSKDQELKNLGLKEYVSLNEFWDFRKGRLYHIHTPSGQILMETSIPYKRPYEVLVFHNGVGRIDGIPDVTLISELQRDINELVSARREIVSRLPRRMLVDAGLFRSDDEFARWKNSKTWEPQLVQKPIDGKIEDRVFVTPTMDTTFDFNRALEEEVESVRRIVGEADYQRGAVHNIRTAAEVDALRGSVEGRVNIRMRLLVRVVSSIFERALDVTKWAVSNPADSRIDLQKIADATQVDASQELVRNDLLSGTPRFRLLPFSPLMEDKNARRETLTNLLPAIVGGPLVEHVDQHELMREIVELFGWRPSIVLSKDSKKAEEEELMAAQMAMQGAAQGAPPGAAPPLPPEAAMAGEAPAGPPPEIAQGLSGII